jgi:hypothetical protein
MTTKALPRTSRPARRNKSSGSFRPEAGISQNAERNYQRYLALARSEALAGDQIAAENYFQHAEHYFRSMAKNKSFGSSEQPVGRPE